MVPFFTTAIKQSKPSELFLWLLVNVLEEADLLIGENKSFDCNQLSSGKAIGTIVEVFQVGLFNFS